MGSWRENGEIGDPAGPRGIVIPEGALDVNRLRIAESAGSGDVRDEVLVSPHAMLAPQPSGRGRGGQGRLEAARRGSLDGPVIVQADTGERTPPGVRGAACAGGQFVDVVVVLLGRGIRRSGPTSGPDRSRGQQPESSGAGHPYAATRQHEVVRPQPGGLNQTGRPSIEAMTHNELALWLRPSFLTPRPRPGSGSRRHAGRSRRG